MFVDLDWPLNASSLLSASAELLVLYTLRHHIVIFDIGLSCWSLSLRELCQPWHYVHHSLPPARKCSNVTDPYEPPDFCLLKSPDQNIFHYKIWKRVSTRKSTGCEQFEAASDWCVSSNGTERYTGAGIDQWCRHLHACIRASARGGHFEYSPWHKLAKTLLTVIN